MTNCPCCGHDVPPDQAKVEMGEDGLPVAISLIEGLGPPVVDGSSARHFRVLLNRVEASACVAFDRKAGVLWRNQKDAAGNYMARDGKLVIERLAGEITLEPTN